MPEFSKLLVGAVLAALGLLPCLAQPSTLEIERVANWPAPLYWQQPAPSGQPDNVNGRAGSGQEKPRVETAQIGETAVFVAITPCRLVDTRNNGYFAAGNFGPPTMTAAQTRMFPVPSGVCSLPATAVAYSFNIAVVPVGTSMRWLTAWPYGDTQPVLATLNDKAGVVTSNAAIVAAGTNGAIDIYVEDATDVIIDVNGYYALPASLPFGGSAAAPALTFGDTTTGLYSTGAGTVDIAAEGSNVATVSSTGLSVPGNLDFGGIITQNGVPLLRSNPLNPGLGTFGDVYLGPNASGSLAATANTGIGQSALSEANSASDANTAVGFNAGSGITSGFQNVAMGLYSLLSGGASSYNTAVGNYTLLDLNGGIENTALGYSAGQQATGSSNTFVGYDAGYQASIGANNTFVGNSAGGYITTGGNNVFIANQGTSYPDAESNTTRIGDTHQTRAFISGIHGVTTGVSGALPVVIDANGQLGTTSSSRRFKTDIADMGDTTDTLMSLRPVQFRYTAYGNGAPLQYGLIAEEVAEVEPELVAHNAKGEIETVYYDKINAMLLNQVQTQQRQIEQMTALVSQLESRLAELESRAK